MRDSLLRRYRRFFGPDPKRDVDEELSFHLAMRADEYRRAGMSEQDALEATMQRFGSMREIRDEVETLAVKRNARRRRALHLDALMQDLRFAWRTLVANPGYSIVVLLTLALGIGANAAVFSVAYGVLLRPLPYRDANSIVRVFSSNIRLNLDGFSVEPSDYATWKRESPAFTAMAAFERQRDATLATRTEPQIVSMSPITPDVFALLGTSPALGRTLVAADARADAPPAAVVSHSLWTTRFGADSTLVGRDLTLDGKRYTVVGVMPPRFFVPGTNAQVWTPLFIESAPPPTGDRHLRVLGRLAPGYTVASAHAQLDVIAARIAKEIPGFSAGWSTKVSSVPEMIIGTQFRRAVLMLVGVVAFVLLIACANAANLQLARAAIGRAGRARCVARTNHTSASDREHAFVGCCGRRRSVARLRWHLLAARARHHHRAAPRGRAPRRSGRVVHERRRTRQRGAVRSRARVARLPHRCERSTEVWWARRRDGRYHLIRHSVCAHRR
jgi:hypothetical protein